MNECHDCVYYSRNQWWDTSKGPPECTAPGGEFPQDGEACKHKLSLAEAKYQNEEGL